uniref:Uncharacterized protein n=1 Tax=Arundo donax TaxID=35708 RepID=A0A0A9AW61_ARUDO
MSVKPSSTASIKMDGPEGPLKFTSAPASTSSFMHFKECPQHAIMSGEKTRFATLLGSAPCSSRIFTI